MNWRTFLAASLVLLPVLSYAAAVGEGGGLANQSDAPEGPCSNLGCEVDCAELSGYAGGGMLSRSCGNRCATTNFNESGGTPTSFVAKCIKDGTRDIKCAQALAELSPTSPPGRREVINAFKELFISGPCAKM